MASYKYDNTLVAPRIIAKYNTILHIIEYLTSPFPKDGIDYLIISIYMHLICN